MKLGQLSGLVVECWPAALKALGSNLGWGAQEFSKLTFISRNSAACQSDATLKLEGALYSIFYAEASKKNTLWTEEENFFLELERQICESGFADAIKH